MEGTMKTAVMTDIMEVEIQERPIPQPKDDEVLVKVEYVGICGSADLICTIMNPDVSVILS